MAAVAVVATEAVVKGVAEEMGMVRMVAAATATGGRVEEGVAAEAEVRI